MGVKETNMISGTIPEKQGEVCRNSGIVLGFLLKTFFFFFLILRGK